MRACPPPAWRTWLFIRLSLPRASLTSPTRTDPASASSMAWESSTLGLLPSARRWPPAVSHQRWSHRACCMLSSVAALVASRRLTRLEVGILTAPALALTASTGEEAIRTAATRRLTTPTVPPGSSSRQGLPVGEDRRRQEEEEEGTCPISRCTLLLPRPLLLEEAEGHPRTCTEEAGQVGRRTCSGTLRWEVRRPVGGTTTAACSRALRVRSLSALTSLSSLLSPFILSLSFLPFLFFQRSPPTNSSMG